MRILLVAMSCIFPTVFLAGCSGAARARALDGSSAKNTTNNEDPNKFTCKKLCRDTPGCPVSSAHCKKEREPAVCWSFYYTEKSRQKTCYHRFNNKIDCPEDYPVYCNPETEEILPNFIPPATVKMNVRANRSEDMHQTNQGRNSNLW